jgi:hypothetical protein
MGAIIPHNADAVWYIDVLRKLWCACTISFFRPGLVADKWRIGLHASGSLLATTKKSCIIANGRIRQAIS